jgi:LysR family transcriptional regulator, transcriptional activator of nhaA
VLNFKHLRYFWMVARAGSIARASEQLGLTPQSISGQLGEFENTLGTRLFRRVGRGLELTEAGQAILGHADEIFSLGDDILETLRDQSLVRVSPLRIGISDSVPKSVAHALLQPVLQMEPPLRLICREGRLASLLGELAVHKLDVVLADRSMPGKLNVRGYSHLLGESRLAAFATTALAGRLQGRFPICLEKAPLLLPGEDVAIRPLLLQWFERMRIRPRIVGEFDDSALLKAFGRGGAGVYFAPLVIAPQIQAESDVQKLGELDIHEALYAITTERRLKHPAIVAIQHAAQTELFGGLAPENPDSELALHRPL